MESHLLDSKMPGKGYDEDHEAKEEGKEEEENINEFPTIEEISKGFEMYVVQHE